MNRSQKLYTVKYKIMTYQPYKVKDDSGHIRSRGCGWWDHSLCRFPQAGDWHHSQTGIYLSCAIYGSRLGLT